MEDRHLEVLLRLDERLVGLTQRVEESIRMDTAAIREIRSNHILLASQVRDHARDIQNISDHRKEIAELRGRIRELETFKKNALWLTGGVTFVVTLVFNKLVALWPWS